VDVKWERHRLANHVRDTYGWPPTRRWQRQSEPSCAAHELLTTSKVGGMPPEVGAAASPAIAEFTAGGAPAAPASAAAAAAADVEAEAVCLMAELKYREDLVSELKKREAERDLLQLRLSGDKQDRRQPDLTEQVRVRGALRTGGVRGVVRVVMNWP